VKLYRRDLCKGEDPLFIGKPGAFTYFPSVFLAVICYMFPANTAYSVYFVILCPHASR
jgi:hypothetical protein